MGERNTTIYLIAAVASILYLAMCFLIVQGVLRNRKMLVADQTIHMLGDSYYAIFRVNFREGRYFAIKNLFSGDILPHIGDYDLLLRAVSKSVCSSTYQAFETSFSLENIRQLVHKGIVDHGGDYQRHFGDTYRWVSVRMLYNPDLSPDVVILCFRDVDQEKRRELQHTLLLQEALDAAQKSTKSRTEFFSRMSHDMRTPLNAVIGCCDLAKRSCDGNDIDKAKDYLKKIAFAGNQLLGLINEILELSRVESGKSSLEYRELNLRSLLVDLVEIFKDQANEENKEVAINIDFQNDIVIGDEKKIIQIVNNLLSNAVKYTNPGGRIRLEARQFVFQRQSKYQILVEDTGIGMTQAFLEHLFDPYSRETAFTPHPVTGTGLGMPIVRNLVHQMSGEISVESELGLGSRFTVTLPFETVETKEMDGQVDPEKDSIESFCWNGRRILVADDNELNREIIATVINQFGAEVLQAEDGQEAVDIFQEEPIYSIDAILMDMQMPKLDGCQAAAAIRRLGREDSDTVPIIAVTANAFAEDVDRTTAAGMNAHVSKPINSTQLRKTMENLITEREIQLKQCV